jgi:transcriptional regulator with GAF, ATPase, and Fis domain
MAESKLHDATWVTFLDGKPKARQLRDWALEVVRGQDQGRKLKLESARARIGGRPGCDLTLTDAAVSRIHCEILLRDDGYLLRDLGSTNGTRLGGRRVVEAYLEPGDIIEVGRTQVRFDTLAETHEVPATEAEQFGGLVGRSLVMRELFARLEKIASTDMTVLVTGPTGAGKEAVAEAIHEGSPRKNGPLVVVDCSALPANLIESELFGHEKGAFTGAVGSHAGAFERAQGGTLFLDELGELPLDMQPKLLRALESRTVRRVGGTKTIPVDARIVAATNRELAVEVNQGRFRSDLFFRLAVAQVRLPSVDERKEDIPLLVAAFLERTPGGGQAPVPPEVLAAFSKAHWPGNVREIRNAVERFVYLGEVPGGASSLAAASPSAPPPPSVIPSSSTVALGSLAGASVGVPVTLAGKETGGGAGQEIDLSRPFKLAKQDLVDEFERRYLRAVLAAAQGNVSAAARIAGLDRMSIHKMMDRLERRERNQDPA